MALRSLTAHRPATEVVGRPGAHARKIRADHYRKAAARGCVAVLAALTGVWAMTNPAVPVSVSALLGATAVMLYGDSTRESFRARQAAIGARSERRVASVIEHVGATAVIHGMLLGAGGDVDHIVAGGCLVAIETKTGSGIVSASEHGLVAGRRRIKGSPVAQVTRQARRLGQIAGVDAAAVVCVPDMVNAPFVVSDVIVTSLRDLPAVLANAPSVTGPRQLEKLLTLATAPA